MHKTDNLQTIYASVADILCPHEVGISASGTAAGNAAIHHAPLPNGAIVYLTYGTEVRVDVAQLGFFLLEIPLTGDSSTLCGKDRILSGPGQVVVSGPCHQFATEWAEDCSKLLVKIERNTLEGYLCTLLGRRQMIRSLDFEMGMNLSIETTASMLRTVQWILDDLDQPGSLFNTVPQAGLQYQRMLMWALLHCQPNNYSKELAAREEQSVPLYILDTMRYIQQNYRQTISLGRLVKHANVSERTLLEGFRRYCDASPMKSLKLTRLDCAHRALKEANSTSNNVTAIALDIGFSQLGKFSTEYKARFGESPSETLKR